MNSKNKFVENDQSESQEGTVNSVIIVGNVGQDPIVKTLADNSSVVMFSLATSENRKQDSKLQEKTEWHTVRVYTNNILPLVNHVKKGAKIYVEGIMRYFSYVDSKTGDKNYSFYIKATEVGAALLKKKPIELSNVMKLKGPVHNVGIDIKEAQEEGADRSYALFKFKLRTHRDVTFEDGTTKIYSDEHNIRGIVNQSAVEEVKSYLAEGSEILIIGKARYVSYTDENEGVKIIRKNVIVDAQDFFLPLLSLEIKKASQQFSATVAQDFSDELPF